MRVRVLGAVELGAHPEVANSGAGRASTQRVLAHMAAVAPGAVSTQALVETAWRENQPTTPEASLRMVITRLRRNLGHDSATPAITRSERGYELTNHVDIDRVTFEHLVSSTGGRATLDRARALRQAVELWRGAPFENLSGPPFESERRRLELIYHDALLELHLIELQSGNSTDVQSRIDEQRTSNPLDEGLAQLSMRSHYATGNQARALDVYERLRNDLREDLGVHPSPETERTHLAILLHDEESLAVSSLRSSATKSRRSVPGVVAAALAPSGDDAEVTTLVREARAGAVLGLWRDATAKYLSAILVEQHAGNHESVADLALETATIVWDPAVGNNLRMTIQDTIPALTDEVRRAQLRICLAGGLDRSGQESERIDDSSALLDDLSLVVDSVGPVEAAWSIVRTRDALSGTIGPQESLALGQRAEALGHDDRAVKSQNRRAVFSDQIRLDMRSQAGSTLQEILRDQAADDSKQRAVDGFGLTAAQNCWNLIEGQFDRVGDGIAQALTYRGRLSEQVIDQVVLAQSFWLCREIPDRANTEAHLEGTLSLADGDPSTPLWLAAASVLAADLGQYDYCLELLSVANSTFDLQSIPAGSHKTGILAFIAEAIGTAAATGAKVDVELAMAISNQLDDDANLGVLLGWPAAFAGPKSRFQGFTRIATGDVASATAHFASAIEADREYPPHRRRSEQALALIT